MKNTAVAIVTTFLSLQAQAAGHVDDLKFSCKGKYQVTTTSTEYHGKCGKFVIPTFIGSDLHQCPSTRSLLPPTTHTVTVTAKVLSADSPSCKLLNDYYGFDLKKGSVYTLKYGALSESEAQDIVLKNSNKIMSFESKQNFSYKKKDGSLPFFPLVHAESVMLFQQYGKADVVGLYGLSEKLSDNEKLKLADMVMQEVQYGKDFNEFGSYPGNTFISLMLANVPDSDKAKKDYASDLLLLFSNLTKFENKLYSNDFASKVGQAINNLFNSIDGTKWSTKIEVYKKHPILLSDGVLSNSFSQKEVPDFTEIEVEDFLEHSLEQVENLSKVKQVYEARVLLNQYKKAAAGIQTNSKVKDTEGTYFLVSEEAFELITAIQDFK